VDEIERENETRALIDKMKAEFTQPFWVFAILIVGGIIGPIGGLIDFIFSFEQEHAIVDFVAAIFLLGFLILVIHVIFISCKTIFFDGNGITIKPFFRELVFYDWSSFNTTHARYYGAALKFSGQSIIKITQGDQFYIDLIAATQIWKNRNYIEE